MYENLTIEMTRKGVTKRQLAELLNIHENSVAYKILHGTFSIEEAFKIKHRFFPQFELEYLFERRATA